MIQQYVSLEPVSHRYFDTDGKEYDSMSRVIARFKKKFDAEKWSRIVAKKEGVSQNQIKKKWDKMRDDAAEHGTRIHDALERYEKEFTILPTDQDLEPMIKAVTELYTGYARIFQEECLYDPEFMIAGTADKILQRTKSSKSIIDIGDYKTNVRRGIEFQNKYRDYMSGPLSHLEDCNYNHYSLQLSAYAYMLENMTGSKIGNLHIMYIPSSNPLAFKRIAVPYMKYEVIEMFKAYQELKVSESVEVKPSGEDFEIQPEEPTFL